MAPRHPNGTTLEASGMEEVQTDGKFLPGIRESVHDLRL